MAIVTRTLRDTAVNAAGAGGTVTMVQTRTSNVNAGVPTSGTITFADLYGATA